MTGQSVEMTPLVDYAVAVRVAKGEVESGDRHLVAPTERGMLVAVVDGMGHGAEAAEAAGLAVSTLEAHANQGIIALVRSCHGPLTGTRGAVMSLASFDEMEGTMTWLGVGNVQGILFPRGEAEDRQSERLFLRPGVVGYRLPKLYAMVTQLEAGDMLVLTTDGIDDRFATEFAVRDEPAQIAKYIVSNFHKENDDGLVLVARYRGLSR